MWSMILLMSRDVLQEVIPGLLAGNRKSSAKRLPTVDTRQSVDRHYQAIGADRTQRSSTG